MNNSILQADFLKIHLGIEDDSGLGWTCEWYHLSDVTHVAKFDNYFPGSSKDATL